MFTSRKLHVLSFFSHLCLFLSFFSFFFSSGECRGGQKDWSVKNAIKTLEIPHVDIVRKETEKETEKNVPTESQEQTKPTDVAEKEESREISQQTEQEEGQVISYQTLCSRCLSSPSVPAATKQ